MDRKLYIHRKNDLLVADCTVSYDGTEQVTHKFISYKPSPPDDDPLNTLNIVVPDRLYTFEIPYVAFENMEALMQADREMALGILKEDLSGCSFVYEPDDRESRHLIVSEGHVIGIGTLLANFIEDKKTLSFFSASRMSDDGDFTSNSLETNDAFFKRVAKAVLGRHQAGGSEKG